MSIIENFEGKMEVVGVRIRIIKIWVIKNFIGEVKYRYFGKVKLFCS